MAINNVGYYASFSNYSDLLGDKPIIYVYAKSQEYAEQKLSLIKGFCKAKNINISKVYMDIGCNNKLDYKINLKKLLNENNNNNILIFNVKILARSLFDLLELSNLCYKNNLKFFDITSDNFFPNEIMYNLIKMNFKGSDEKMQNKIDILFVEPNKLPVKKTIDDTLDNMQKLVGGHIEYTYLPNCEDVSIICNEEGKILGLPFNRDIGHDVIAGNFIIVGLDETGDKDISLTKEQIDKYTKYFGKESIEKTNKKITEMENSLDDYYM